MKQPLVPVTTEGFREKALAIPDAVDRALAKATTEEEIKHILNGVDILAQYAKKIEADTTIVNSIQYGRLKVIARYGDLCQAIPPEESGARGGRGNKGCTPTVQPFHRNTLSAFRKVAVNQDKIDDYRGQAEKADAEMSTKGFIRFATGTEKAGRSAHVSANTGVPEWYTPAAYIEAARKVLGDIDLDPASSEIAQRTVQATTYYTIESDGLAQPWSGRVWMNPPYSSDLVSQFVGKLCDHFEAGDIPAALVLVNNATETRWFQRVGKLASAVCFPEGRVKFLNEDGNPGAPLQGQAILYFGGETIRFLDTFGTFGLVLLGEDPSEVEVDDQEGVKEDIEA